MTNALAMITMQHNPAAGCGEQNHDPVRPPKRETHMLKQLDEERPRH
jgi:hypothetical protein